MEIVDVTLFHFEVPIRNFFENYFNRGPNDEIEETFKQFIVGDRDLIFNVYMKARKDNTLEIKLIRTSQKLSTIHVLECRAFTDGLLSVPFKNAILVAGSDDSKSSTVTLSRSWEVTDLSKQQNGEAIIWISGKIFYSKLQSISLQKDLKCLLNDKETSDVEIIVGDVTFPSHKLLLGARSSVFRAMLTGTFKEGAENVIKLPNDNPEVFGQLLHYIYTDCCPQISTMVLDLLVLADKYDLQGLRMLCEEEMLETINTENVCDYMVKSSMIPLSKRIYNACLNFFNAKKCEILKTEGWKILKEMENSATIAFDIIEKK